MKINIRIIKKYVTSEKGLFSALLNFAFFRLRIDYILRLFLDRFTRQHLPIVIATRLAIA